MKKFNDPTLKDLRRKLRKSLTREEKIIWDLIRDRKIQGLKFFRQYSVGNYILDFYCPEIKLCIELDGGQHSEKASREADETRTNYLNSFQIKLIRFWNNDIIGNLEGAYEKIIQTINKYHNHNSSQPPLILRGGIR